MELETGGVGLETSEGRFRVAEVRNVRILEILSPTIKLLYTRRAQRTQQNNTDATRWIDCSPHIPHAETDMKLHLTALTIDSKGRVILKDANVEL